MEKYKYEKCDLINTEAEYVAVSEVVKETKFYTNF